MAPYLRQEIFRWLMVEEKTFEEIVKEEVSKHQDSKKPDSKKDSEEAEDEEIFEGVDTVEEIKEGQESKYGI